MTGSHGSLTCRSRLWRPEERLLGPPLRSDHLKMAVAVHLCFSLPPSKATKLQCLIAGCLKTCTTPFKGSRGNKSLT